MLVTFKLNQIEHFAMNIHMLESVIRAVKATSVIPTWNYLHSEMMEHAVNQSLNLFYKNLDKSDPVSDKPLVQGDFEDPYRTSLQKCSKLFFENFCII